MTVENLTVAEKQTIMSFLERQDGVNFELALQKIAKNFAPEGVTEASLRDFYFFEMKARNQRRFGARCTTAFT